MSFTTYASAIAGSVLTAAFWNAQVKNNGLVLKTSINDDGTLQALMNMTRVVSTVTVSNTVVETTLLTVSVPGGTLGTNKHLRFWIFGDYLNDTGALQGCTIRVKYGATLILTLTTAGALAPSTDRRVWSIEGKLSAANATNAQKAWMRGQFGNVTTDDGAVFEINSLKYEGKKTTISEDSTAAKTFTITLQHDNASANQVARVDAGALDVMR